MLSRRIFGHLRPYLPLALYPVLAVPYRWSLRRAFRRLERDDAAFHASHPGLAAPPARLRYKVTARLDGVAKFLASGEAAATALEQGAAAAGSRLAALGPALDFGCGCGRTARAVRARWPELALAGTDVDPEAVAWCREHLPGARFEVNGELPPLAWPDAHFALAWAISVFTHLDEERQFRWLAELRRVLAPGGLLLASVHGPRFWQGLPRGTVARIRAEGMLYATVAADRGLHPEWYQVTWHTPEYVAARWPEVGFELVAYRELGMQHQDLVVLRRS